MGYLKCIHHLDVVFLVLLSFIHDSTVTTLTDIYERNLIIKHGKKSIIN